MTDKWTHKQTEYPLVDSTPLVGGVKWKLIFFSGIFSKESQRQSKTGTFCFCVLVSALAILYERENIVRMTEYCTDDRILYGRRIVCVRRHNICWAGGFYTILLPNILLSTVLLILHFVLSTFSIMTHFYRWYLLKELASVISKVSIKDFFASMLTRLTNKQMQCNAGDVRETRLSVQLSVISYQCSFVMLVAWEICRLSEICRAHFPAHHSKPSWENQNEMLHASKISEFEDGWSFWWPVKPARLDNRTKFDKCGKAFDIYHDHMLAPRGRKKMCCFIN